jgi:uncharacterized protein (TIGR02996 family)
MTDVEQALLRHIGDHPTDDVPRLVYADWLDEHGRTERAEFIRVQCALAQAEATGRTVTRLRRREQALMPTICSELLGLPKNDTRVPLLELRRGFISVIRISAQDLLLYKMSTEPMCIPPRVVHVNMNLPHDMETLLTWPLHPTATAIDFAPYRGQAKAALMESIRIMCFCSTLHRLSKIIAKNMGLTWNDLNDCLSSPIWPQLKFIDLSGNQLANQALAALVRANPNAKLLLNYNLIDDNGVDFLLTSEQSTPPSLSLYYNRLSPGVRQRLRERWGDRIQC